MSSNYVFHSFDTNLMNSSDEELIQLINQGNQEALELIFKRYKELVNMKISKYFIVGAEKEDIFQEGRPTSSSTGERC